MEHCSEAYEGFDGSHLTMEEGTLSALGLNPDSVNSLTENITPHVRRENNGGELKQQSANR